MGLLFFQTGLDEEARIWWGYCVLFKINITSGRSKSDSVAPGNFS